MSMTRFLTAAAAISLLAGAAHAQSTAPATTSADQTAPAASDQTTPSTAPADSTAPAASDSMSAPTAATGTAVPTSSMSSDQQSTLRAGDANVVTNGPVADTPENRAKYGAPMSRAGKRTAPKGN